MAPKFLVVDDDFDVRVLMEALLSSLGCEVVLADGGKKALEMLNTPEEAKKIDGVFLDLMMPEMNGIEVFQQLRDTAHTKTIPVIMLTAKGSCEDIMNGYQLGADYYIPKPFTKAQIVYGLDMLFGDDEEKKKQLPALYLPEVK